MNKLYNGLEVNFENVLAMMLSVDESPEQSDMTYYQEAVCKKVAAGGYEGAQEDLESLVDELNTYSFYNEFANNQAVYDILSAPDCWNYQRDKNSACKHCRYYAYCAETGFNCDEITD